jgi:hypothetical protein
MAVDHGALGSPDQRTDDSVGLARIADLQALRDRDETLAERVENRLLDQDTRVGHAHLDEMQRSYAPTTAGTAEVAASGG